MRRGKNGKTVQHTQKWGVVYQRDRKSLGWNTEVSLALGIFPENNIPIIFYRKVRINSERANIATDDSVF